MDYVNEMNNKLHKEGFTPYELTTDKNGMIVAGPIAYDTLRLANEDRGLDCGYVQVIKGIPVKYFKMNEIVLVKQISL